MHYYVKVFYFLACTVLVNFFGYAQKKLVILGSSTSACAGPSIPDSCYVARLQQYYGSSGIPVAITNLAVGGTTVYRGMPSSYSPPAYRETPDIGHNITAALATNPDVILVNFPSNGYDIFSVAEVMFCLRTIKQVANSAGKPCYVTTTQPRSEPSSFRTSETRRKMAQIKDSVLNEFGSFGINFWDGIVNPADSTALPFYSAGDGIHLNNAAHGILAQRVEQKNIFGQQPGTGGLNYRYYEGSWNALPNFNALTPLKAGTIPNVDLSVRNVNDNFGVIWEGYINIPTAGNYIFETISDDGSKLYFNSLYSPTATALVNNDGLHPARSIAATVNIPVAGRYPLEITFFEQGGGESMQVFWSGPGIARQLIPNSAFVGGAPSGPDTIPPIVPGNLRLVSAANNSINLGWDICTDIGGGVAGYDIYRDGTLRYTTSGLTITADGLVANTSYTFTVKARDAAGNTSGFSNPLSASTTNTVANGLNYRYYEGTWTALPNFNLLSPIKTGITPNIDLSVRTPGRNDNFAFVWEGFINIPTAGTYIFETASDDGSKLYFNTPYSPTATALVNNDGLHGPWTPATGTVNIPAAGIYPIAISFFEAYSGESMQVYWSGPGIVRQLIPNSKFTSSSPPDNTAPSVPGNLRLVSAANNSINLAWEISTDNVGMAGYDVYRDGTLRYTTSGLGITADGLVANTSYSFTVKARDVAGNTSGFSNALIASTTNTVANGLNYRYYEGTWTALPNFNSLTPVKTGTTPNIDLSVRTPGRNDNFAFVWEGYISIPTAGSYTFETVSDDGSKLYFNTTYSPTATPLVNNDGIHGPWTAAIGTVNVPAAGVYPIAISFFEAFSGESMQVYWTGPGIARQLIPNNAFIQNMNPLSSTGSFPLNSENTVAASYGNRANINSGRLGIINAYPNPFTDVLNIQLENIFPGNNVSLGLFDMSGRSLQHYYFGGLRSGNNTLKIHMNPQRKLGDGIYLVKMIVNGVTQQAFKVVKGGK